MNIILLATVVAMTPPAAIASSWMFDTTPIEMQKTELVQQQPQGVAIPLPRPRPVLSTVGQSQSHQHHPKKDHRMGKLPRRHNPL